MTRKTAETTCCGSLLFFEADTQMDKNWGVPRSPCMVFLHDLQAYLHLVVASRLNSSRISRVRV